MPARSTNLCILACLLAVIIFAGAEWKYETQTYSPVVSKHILTPPADAKLLLLPAADPQPEVDQPAVAQDKPPRGVPILMYHKVSPDPNVGGLTYRVPPDDFDWQMHYLQENGYHTVDIGAVVDHFQKGADLPEKAVVITLDDGYQDNYVFAFPILKKYGLTATVFVVTDIVGGVNEFDTKAHRQPRTSMLTWDEIKEMDAGGITIGAHTLDHSQLSKISLKEAKRQIVESKQVLEKRLGKEVQYFCYPYGQYSSAVVRLVKDNGFRAATSIEPGLVTSVKDPYLLKRIAIMGQYDHQRFIKELHRD
ncbi:MAG TPA: polysaccharide deacetylase family protein [Syntrophomonadaceae bacterium]|nr:polysaccharide deacetylase family protein [Syntrophomonadaceae bacterium]